MAEPRRHTRRSDRPTNGTAAAAVARAKGRPFMPWQQRAADVALEIDPATGLYWYGLVIVTVQRQAGKTKLESDVADHRCLTVPDARVWYTAQTGKDASAWMRDEHFPALARAGVFGKPRTPRCRYTLSKRAGQEGVDWRHGSTFRVFAPLRDALHGKQGDLIFIDEAWALSAEQGADVRQAVRPTMNTRPGSQLWPVSTLGDDSSVFFDSYVEQAAAQLDNPNSRVCLIDYGLRDGDDPEDLDVIAARHPAYGYTLHRPALEAARADFAGDPAGWARAYGNVPTRSRVAAFGAGVWAAAGTALPDMPTRYGLGLDATPDGNRAAVSGGWRDPAGIGYVEPIWVDAPTRETPALMAQLAVSAGGVPITVDRAAIGALDLADAAARAGAEIVYLSSNDYASACVQFHRGITAGTIKHSNDPDLNAAADLATTRPLSDGAFGWARKTATGSIAELVSATIALRAYDELPAPKRRPVAYA